MATSHLNAIKPFLLFFLFGSSVILSGCNLLTGNIIKERPIADPVFIRCSDTAGLTVFDYCEINNTLKLMLKNRQYVSIEGIEVTFVTEQEKYTKDFSLRLSPSITKLIDVSFPERMKDYLYVKLRPSSYDPNGVIAPCRIKMIEHDAIRTCVYD